VHELGFEHRFKGGYMTDRPLVSVIMPVYNESPEYLGFAVDSILCQAYDNIEFLIMDDGSDPETAAALYAITRGDERIRLFRQKNAGLTVSLNNLIREARGDFIARQDSDDISEPERLQKQVAFFAAHPDLMLLGTDCLIIDSQGKVLHRQRVETRPRILKRRLWSGNQFVHGSVMFSSTLFKDKMNLYYEGFPNLEYYKIFRYAEDYDLFLRISERYGIANLSTPLYRYRINTNGISLTNAYDQQSMTMVVSEAARLRRKGQIISWSQETYDRIAASLDTPRFRRHLECIVCSGQGRNLLLAGRKAEARKMFWRSLTLSPSIRRLWHLLRSCVPWRWVR